MSLSLTMIDSLQRLDSESAFDTAKNHFLNAGPMRGESEETHLAYAKSVGYELVSAYWQACVRDRDIQWALPTSQLADRIDIGDDAVEIANAAGAVAARLNPAEAAYRIGSLYAALLPAKYRSKHGIYYTPPALVARLLAVAENHGVNWGAAKVLDPACGGGAFLSPVAARMMSTGHFADPDKHLCSIEKRLLGFDLDPFGAWCAQVFAEVALLPLCKKAGRRLQKVVRVCDSLLQFASPEKFDLVIGNPPYGRTKLSPGVRERYERSLFGHANLYTIFTDLSLRLAKQSGVVALVTPTSFLAGEYFKSLRRVLVQLAYPLNFDFVSARKGVFDQVLQETVLATYRKGTRPSGACSVNIIRPCAEEMHVDSIANLVLPTDSSNPWPLPRTKKQVPLIRSMNGHRYRLRDYGYEVATGQLVWNRHKDQLRSEYGPGGYPLIWAESIGPEGQFEFRAEKRNHQPFFKPRQDQEWLITRETCILLQRTTAKEQTRRLIAAILPRQFVDDWGGAVIENHVNIIRPLSESPEVSITHLADLLNSEVMDEAFRCISGSVAVSAYELNALPLPEPSQLTQVFNGNTREVIQRNDLNSRLFETYMHPFNDTSSAPYRRRDPAAAA